jgi:hypothetical protein
MNTVGEATNKRSWKRIVAASAIVAGSMAMATSIGSGSASAADPCAARTTKQAFKQWGDTNQYFSVTNGTFESGTGGWQMTKATAGTPSVVTDQEPWKVNGTSHTKALKLPAYSTAMAPFMCVASNEEWLRFFYKDPGVGGAGLLAKVEVRNASGAVAINTYTIGASSAGWKVGPQVYLPNLRDANGEQWISVTFTPVNNAATWYIDDVMIDPWVSR